MVESLTPWVVPVHDTRGSETTSPMCTHFKIVLFCSPCWYYPRAGFFAPRSVCFSEFQVQICFVT